MKFINYNKHHLDKQDILSVIKSLKSEKLTQGSFITKFETNLKKKFKSKYCVVVSNGTAALHLALISIGLKKNEIVCSSPISFLAGANMVKIIGGKNFFIDIDEKTNNLDPYKLEIFLKKKKKIKAVIATDYGGYPCDWEMLKFLKEKYHFYLINDNCHAIGSMYNRQIGYAVKYADMATHSYHAVKNFTTGEGGSILTNNFLIYNNILSLRNHGLEKIKKNIENPNWPFILKNVGFNYRITDFQCALGLSQLKKINFFIRKRNEIANYYFNNLRDIRELELPNVDKNIYNSYHLFPIKINFKKLNISKKKFILDFKKKGINFQIHYFPIHKQPAHFVKNADLKCAEKFYESAISLPLYVDIKKNTLKKICQLLKKYINRKYI